MNDARLIKFGSVCSGIEAASVAWESLGFSAAWVSEIDKFPCAVLAHHYPKIKNLGDMSNIAAMIKSQEIEAPEVLVGGTPCQAFSVAGLRAGLSDSRGQLTLKFVELANAIDAQRRSDGLGESIIVWENVPGVLSSKDNAFGCFLAGLAGESEPLEPPGGKWANAGCVLGPQRAIAWRVLDAQYFGLAQRRRRVFVVASARDGFDPAAVLFEFDGLRRDSAPSRAAPQNFAGTLDASLGRGRGAGTSVAALTANGVGTCGADDNQAQAVDLIPAVTATLDANYGKLQGCSGQDMNHGHSTLIAPTMRAMGHDCSHANAGGQLAVAIQDCSGRDKAQNGCGWSADGGMQVRRLTAEECEFLQGFPRGYTAIPWRGKAATDCPDSPRYKALGNSMAVNVMQWIGRRVQEYLHGGQSDFKTGQSCQRLLTARAAQNGAPGRSRTCDPRLRRPS